jgi:DNA processing protein
VFAVPGQLNQTFSLGCNKLIRENRAQIYTRPQDLIEAVRWDKPASSDSLSHPRTAAPSLPLDVTEEESQILSLLRQTGDCHIDDLSWKSTIPMGNWPPCSSTWNFGALCGRCRGKSISWCSWGFAVAEQTNC